MTERNLPKLLEIEEIITNNTKQTSNEIKTIEIIMMKFNDILQINNCTTKIINEHNAPIKQLFQQIYDDIKEIYGESDDFDRRIAKFEELIVENEKNHRESTNKQMNELQQLEDSTKTEIDEMKHKLIQICDEINETKNITDDATKQLDSIEKIHIEKNETINKINQNITELRKIDFAEEQQTLNDLISNNHNNGEIIKNLENQKSSVIEMIDKYEVEIAENAKIIDNLSQRKAELKQKETELQAKIVEALQEFGNLNTQFSDKQQQTDEIKQTNELKMSEITNLIENKKKNLDDITLKTIQQNEVIELGRGKDAAITDEIEALKLQISSYKDGENVILKEIDELQQFENIEKNIEDLIQTITNQETELQTKQTTYETLQCQQSLKEMEIKMKTTEIEFDEKIQQLQNEISEIQTQNQNSEENLNDNKLRIEAININKNRLLLKRNQYAHNMKILEQKIIKYEKVKNYHLNTTKDRSFTRPIDRALMDSFAYKDDDSSSSASGGERMTYAEFIATRK